MDGCCGRVASLCQHGTHWPRLLEEKVATNENVLNYCAPAHLKGKEWLKTDTIKDTLTKSSLLHLFK